MAQEFQGFREAFTFDDVLLKPGLSDILPSEVDIRSRVTRDIALNIPIIASAMDTVTEARMAIAMAQCGGVGVIHRNFDPEGQAAQVRQVKKFESGMGVNPLTTTRVGRFSTNHQQKVWELMTHENLVTVREGVGQEEAKRMLHKHRIEKLVVVDEQYRCVGLITGKDIETAGAHPLASKDAT